MHRQGANLLFTIYQLIKERNSVELKKYVNLLNLAPTGEQVVGSLIKEGDDASVEFLLDKLSTNDDNGFKNNNQFRLLFNEVTKVYAESNHKEKISELLIKYQDHLNDIDYMRELTIAFVAEGEALARDHEAVKKTIEMVKNNDGILCVALHRAAYAYAKKGIDINVIMKETLTELSVSDLAPILRSILEGFAFGGYGHQVVYRREVDELPDVNPAIVMNFVQGGCIGLAIKFAAEHAVDNQYIVHAFIKAGFFAIPDLAKDLLSRIKNVQLRNDIIEKQNQYLLSKQKSGEFPAIGAEFFLKKESTSEEVIDKAVKSALVSHSLLPQKPKQSESKVFSEVKNKL